MRNIFLLIFTLLFVQNSMQAYTYKTFTPVNDNANTYNYYNSGNNGSDYGNNSDIYNNFKKFNQPSQNTTNAGNESYPKVTQIENMLFKRTYENEDVSQRLSRIENKMFRRTNAQMDLYQRVSIINDNIDPGLMYNIPTNNLAKIESKLFNRAYPNDEIETRIIRLEKEMLGAMQNGSLDERYQVVAEASKHYNAFPYVSSNGSGQNYYQNYAQNYPQNYSQNYNNYSGTTSGSGRGVGGFLSNILSSLVGGGTMTGYTPPMNYSDSPYGYDSMYPQYNSWGSNYNPNSTGYDKFLRTRNGYYNNSTNYGNGSSVQVLYD